MSCRFGFVSKLNEDPVNHQKKQKEVKEEVQTKNEKSLMIWCMYACRRVGFFHSPFTLCDVPGSRMFSSSLPLSSSVFCFSTPPLLRLLRSFFPSLKMWLISCFKMSSNINVQMCSCVIVPVSWAGIWGELIRCPLLTCLYITRACI